VHAGLAQGSYTVAASVYRVEPVHQITGRLPLPTGLHAIKVPQSCKEVDKVNCLWKVQVYEHMMLINFDDSKP